jgi:AraC-like DNA-binding protein
MTGISPHADTLRRLRGAAMRFGLVAGLDTGSWLMARAGLLDGYRATSHWDVLSGFVRGLSGGRRAVSDRFVIDRDRASCGGATATLDLMLDLVGRQARDDAGARCGGTVPLWRRCGPTGGAHAGPAAADPARGGGTDAAASSRSRLTIAAIASALGLSQRRLEALFRDPCGSHRPCSSIAGCGWRRRTGGGCWKPRRASPRSPGAAGTADPAAMTRAFRAEYATTPSGSSPKRRDTDSRNLMPLPADARYTGGGTCNGGIRDAP